MKRFAFLRENGVDTMVNIWKAQEYQNKYKPKGKDVFFSTRYDYSKRMPMIISHRGKTAFFKYKSRDNYPTGEGYEESATHELYKKLMTEIQNPVFKCWNKKKKDWDIYTFHITKYDLEYEILENRCRVDVMLWFDDSTPKDLFIKWNGKFAVEIWYTHKVDEQKRQLLENNKIATFERKIDKNNPDMLVSDEDMENEEAEKKRILYLSNKYFSEYITATLISNPKSEEFIEMEKIQELEKQVSILANEINTNKDIIKSQKSKIQIQENQNDNLVRENRNLQFTNKELQNELTVIKKSLFFKVYSLFHHEG